MTSVADTAVDEGFETVQELLEHWELNDYNSQVKFIGFTQGKERTRRKFATRKKSTSPQNTGNKKSSLMKQNLPKYTYDVILSPKQLEDINNVAFTQSYLRFWVCWDREGEDKDIPTVTFSVDQDRVVLPAHTPSSKKHIQMRLQNISKEKSEVCSSIKPWLKEQQLKLEEIEREKEGLRERLRREYRIEEKLQFRLKEKKKRLYKEVEMKERSHLSTQRYQKSIEDLTIEDVANESEEERLAAEEHHKKQKMIAERDARIKKKYGISTDADESSYDRSQISLRQLLRFIFEAADEDCTEVLPYSEVLALLQATLMQQNITEDAATKSPLDDWDIRLLLSKTHENVDGTLHYETFLKTAPEEIKVLSSRRQEYNAQNAKILENDPDYFAPDRIVTADMILLCCEHEMAETSKAINVLRDFKFNKISGGDSSSNNLLNNGYLTRSQVRELLYRTSRLGPKEIAMIMSYLPQEVPTNEDLIGHLINLRVAVLQNACVETNDMLLGTHIAQCVLKALETPTGANPEVGGNQDQSQNPNQMNQNHSQNLSYSPLSVWNLKNVLRQANEVLLSFNQIHAILCCIIPDESGYVDPVYFVKMVIVLIRKYFFDRKRYIDLAFVLQHDKDDDNPGFRKNKNLKGAVTNANSTTANSNIHGTTNNTSNNNNMGPNGGPNDTADGANLDSNAASGPGNTNEEAEKSREHLEREILQLNLSKRQIDAGTFLQMARSELPGFGLSHSEVRGFVSEAEIDGSGEINFAEHAKLWISMVFDMRRDPFLFDVIHKDFQEDLQELSTDSDLNSMLNRVLLPITKAMGTSLSAMGGFSINDINTTSSAGPRRTSTGTGRRGSQIGKTGRRQSVQNNNNNINMGNNTNNAAANSNSGGQI